MTDNPQDPPLLTPADAHALPTWRAAYSDRTAAMMAAFSQLAYVPFEDAPAPAGAPRPEMPGGRQLLADCLAGGGFELKGVVNQDDVQAFLAVNPSEFAVLSFRGTANWDDWKIDLNAPLIRLPDHKGVRIHRGFWEAFLALSYEIRPLVDSAPKDLGLYITGHSLGGALAQIASMAFERDTLAACYTFGSPRVATLDFDVLVKCPHYRLVDDWDLVPGVPPPWPWGGYLHSGDPRLLSGPAPKEALRRDQGTAARTLHYLWSFLVWPFSGRISIIDEHMIWSYRTKLEAIARARAGPEMAAAARDMAGRAGSAAPPDAPTPPTSA